MLHRTFFKTLILSNVKKNVSREFIIQYKKILNANLLHLDGSDEIRSDTNSKLQLSKYNKNSATIEKQSMVQCYTY